MHPDLLDLDSNFTFLSEDLPILSVSDLSFNLKQLVEKQFKKVKVKGEVSSLKRHTSGHVYFTLKDKDSVLNATCWRGTSLKVQLEEGAEVIITGRLTTYISRSQYQINVESVEIAGEGALLKLLIERKNRLQAEGLFGRKRPLPLFPKRIGIITSPTGAVIQDILHRIQDRYPCHIVLWPVAVQGAGAAEQIRAAIEGFNTLPVLDQPSLLIVARGGGSLEDLWCFNEEIVVRATASSMIPIISAIGHETDTTLIDWAADLRAPTPTAAAELATPILSQVAYTLHQYNASLYRLIQRQLRNDTTNLVNLGRALLSPRQILEHTMLRLDDWSDRLLKAQQVLLSYRHQTLSSFILRPPVLIIQRGQELLSSLFERFIRGYQRFLQQQQERLNWHQLSLEQNSYQRILKRGFCLITTSQGVTCKANQFTEDLRLPLSLQFSDGKVHIDALVKNITLD